MKTIKTAGAVTLAAALAASMAACQPQGSGEPGEEASKVTNTDLAQSDAQYNPQERDAIKDGGTLTTATTEITPQFNTFHADGTRYTLDLWKWYNPIMALYSPEGEWSFNDDYLTDVQHEDVDGNTVVTYTIRDDANFNDGTPIDWKAFEATWKTNSGEDDAYSPSSTDGYDRISSVEPGENDKQVVVTWEGGWAWWQGQFNYILHPDAADAKVYEEGYINNPHPEWGAGPYTVKEFDEKGGTIVFERNPKWWGDKGKLDERVFTVMEDQASMNAFRNGQLDATGVGNKERLAQVQDMEGIEIRQAATPSSSLLMLNANNKILADQKVRQAIFKGIDRETLLQVRYDGMDYTEELPGSFMLFPFQEDYVDNFAAAGLSFDAEAAKAQLEEAGWTAGDDGMRAKDGETLSMNYVNLGDSATGKAISLALQKMMKDIGVDMKIDNRPSSDFSKVYNNQEFDMFSMGFASSDPFGQAYFCQIYCSNSGLNLSNTGTKEFDEKIKEGAAILDQTEQTAALNKLEEEAFQLAGILPMWNGPTMVAAKDGLANYGASLFYVGKPQDIGWQA
ncbi:MAG TPA: ABC transporter family substrate-binding protein [Candidatus Avipropionibacterium avicola]|uniref:ABC transporter family substrate-binding protein n=1 Tax=Candidatus Avipropionibacterium avicola TaxID=2840701 RepID=A0A9D1KNR7_9ACTN|nr:ABC transporter family substrate-binding protein [Candidatus Avipropionibacterium avicola]